MLIYKILACLLLIGFAVVAYLYIIFQMPVPGLGNQTVEKKTKTDLLGLIETIHDR